MPIAAGALLPHVTRAAGSMLSELEFAFALIYALVNSMLYLAFRFSTKIPSNFGSAFTYCGTFLVQVLEVDFYFSRDWKTFYTYGSKLLSY